MGFGECRGLGVARPWIGGSLVGGGEGCASVSSAAGAMVSTVLTEKSKIEEFIMENQSLSLFSMAFAKC
jgi:hypothetical protein